jgi:hypothetical protein
LVASIATDTDALDHLVNELLSVVR